MNQAAQPRDQRAFLRECHHVLTKVCKLKWRGRVERLLERRIDDKSALITCVREMRRYFDCSLRGSNEYLLRYKSHLLNQMDRLLTELERVSNSPAGKRRPNADIGPSILRAFNSLKPHLHEAEPIAKACTDHWAAMAQAFEVIWP